MADYYAPALIEELKLHGVKEYEIDRTGKHDKLRFRWQGKTLMHVFPKSASDSYRGLLNSLSDLRKSLGVSRIVRKSETRVEKIRRKPVAPVSAEKLTITVKPDPFTVLARIKEPPKPEVVRCPRMTLAQIVAMMNSEQPSPG